MGQTHVKHSSMKYCIRISNDMCNLNAETCFNYYYFSQQDDGIVIQDYHFNNGQTMRLYGGYILNVVVLNADGDYVRYTFPNPLITDEEERKRKAISPAGRATAIEYGLIAALISQVYITSFQVQLTSISSKTTNVTATSL